MRIHPPIKLGFAILAVLLSQACDGDTDPTRRGVGGGGPGDVSKYDAEHPDWKMHPGAVIVEREDVEFIYDVTVMDGKLVVPTAGHEAFIATLVPGRTILVGRQNETDLLKNAGFLRGVLTVTRVAENTEITTKQMALADVVRGHLGNATTKIVGIAPEAGAATQGKGLRPQAHFAAGTERPLYIPLALDSSLKVDLSGALDVDRALKTVVDDNGVKTESSLAWINSVATAIRLDGQIHLQPTLDFSADVDPNAAFGWFDSSIDVDVKKVHTSFGLAYEAQAAFDMQFAGKISGNAQITDLEAETNLWPGCTIGGLPCQLTISTTAICTARIEGAFNYKTTKPARIYGTPTMGVEFANGEMAALPSSLLAYEAPEFTNDVAAGATAVRPSPTAKSATAKGFGQIECTYEPRVEFFVGEKFRWWKLSAEASAGAFATIAPLLSARGASCWTHDFETSQWLDYKWGAGLQGRLRPMLRGQLVSTFGGVGLDSDLDLDLPETNDLFDLKKGTLDLGSPPTCL